MVGTYRIDDHQHDVKIGALFFPAGREKNQHKTGKDQADRCCFLEPAGFCRLMVFTYILIHNKYPSFLISPHPITSPLASQSHSPRQTAGGHANSCHNRGARRPIGLLKSGPSPVREMGGRRFVIA
jgi:hypothetical protein